MQASKHLSCAMHLFLAGKPDARYPHPRMFKQRRGTRECQDHLRRWSFDQWQNIVAAGLGIKGLFMPPRQASGLRRRLVPAQRKWEEFDLFFFSENGRPAPPGGDGYHSCVLFCSLMIELGVEIGWKRGMVSRFRFGRWITGSRRRKGNGRDLLFPLSPSLSLFFLPSFRNYFGLVVSLNMSLVIPICIFFFLVSVIFCYFILII